MPELLLIPHNIVLVKFNHWQVFKHQQAAQESEYDGHPLNLPAKLQQWILLPSLLIGGIKPDIISTLKLGKHSVGLPCWSQSDQNYHLLHIQDKYNTIKY